METEKKPEVINIELYDRAVGYWGRIARFWGMLAAAIGIGVVLHSDALQWVGVVIWFIATLGMARDYKKDRTMTPQAAADYLRRQYGVTGQ